jgi:glycosyltransferase involved in cell wall biosynthesis
VKIVHVIARLNVGGPARNVTLLNAQLGARGHQTLLVHGALAPGEAALELPERVRAIPMLFDERLGRSVSPLNDLAALGSMLRVLKREHPDVVHTHTAKAGAIGRIAVAMYNAMRPAKARCAVVHTFHGHVLEGYFSPAMNRVVRVVERQLARLADRIVTISDRQRHDIVERFRVAPAEKTVTVPIDLDVADLFALPPPEGGPDAARDVVVGYLGRLVPIKDVGTLLRAFAQARSRHPHMRLIIGGDGPERPALERLSAELGVAAYVTFAGWIADLPAFYSSIDILALSSLNEGTPVSLFEAMAAARPVVATSVGGVPDVVEDGVTGVLTAARAVTAFADALECFARSPERRAAIGAAGRRFVLTHYGDDRLIDLMEQTYAEAVTEKRQMNRGRGSGQVRT